MAALSGIQSADSQAWARPAAMSATGREQAVNSCARSASTCGCRSWGPWPGSPALATRRVDIVGKSGSTRAAHNPVLAPITHGVVFGSLQASSSQDTQYCAVTTKCEDEGAWPVDGA